MKLKEGPKPTTLMLDFNPQEFEARQNKFKIYYCTSRMNTLDAKEHQEYFYSCISEPVEGCFDEKNTLL